jgi:hypothetical protein
MDKRCLTGSCQLFRGPMGAPTAPMPLLPPYQLLSRTVRRVCQMAKGGAPAPGSASRRGHPLAAELLCLEHVQGVDGAWGVASPIWWGPLDGCLRSGIEGFFVGFEGRAKDFETRAGLEAVGGAAGAGR